jgi:hypothetical protein
MEALTLRLRRWWPAPVDAVVLGLLALAYVVLYGPAFAVLSRTLWASDEQGHGPIILGLSFVLLGLRAQRIAAAAGAARPLAGWTLLVLALLLFIVGDAQDILHVPGRQPDPAAGGAAAAVRRLGCAARGLVPAVLPAVHGAAARGAGGGRHHAAEVGGVGGGRRSCCTWPATPWGVRAWC